MSIGPESKEVVLIDDGIKTPPLSPEARKEIGALLRRVQDGLPVAMP